MAIQKVYPIFDVVSHSPPSFECALIRQINADYAGCIQAIYFYEWRDNLHHTKIWNVEGSPIHVAFGLCDRFGVPKFDLKALL
ncbi:MAG: hypothetical protein JXA89_06945 [Anaerolineae bacterium]|nr:hypothetical protein [Anaerolineae bacterium]